MTMTSKEIVRRTIHHQDHPRIAWDFATVSDLKHVGTVRLINKEAEPFYKWGYYPELQKKANFMNGEVCMDVYGNILGRLNGITKGECVLGALESGLEDIDKYSFPQIDLAFTEKVKAENNFKDCDKYVLSGLPFGVFSTLRDLRLMVNALMDIAADPELVENYLEKFAQFAVKLVDLAGDCGVDGVMIADDWGMQDSPFISPNSFAKLFKPVYKKITDACHNRGMDFLLHSCGYVLPLVPHELEAGIDVFQFDQPEAAGSELWARDFGDKAAFYSPVDIQKILPTGDRELIETTAYNMVTNFKKYGGSLIAKDYPDYPSVGVKPEWATWARDVILKNSDMK
ncbi:MAG: hypothetical protein IJB92_08995 [Clostridia bacterium]|nr:hypothetical protein [Clostridia bacterium]